MKSVSEKNFLERTKKNRWQSFFQATPCLFFDVFTKMIAPSSMAIPWRQIRSCMPSALSILFARLFFLSFALLHFLCLSMYLCLSLAIFLSLYLTVFLSLWLFISLFLFSLTYSLVSFPFSSIFALFFFTLVLFLFLSSLWSIHSAWQYPEVE